jgi:hypothetical protein
VGNHRPGLKTHLQQKQTLGRIRYFGWFMEGFDTRDLQEAKALLKSIAA